MALSFGIHGDFVARRGGNLEVSANPKFSAIAVDARTGEVLFSSDPDGKRYPASLTKVMTLYILFGELKAGRMTLATQLKMSKRASGMAPTKLGVPAGKTVAVEDAIKALVTFLPTMSPRRSARTLPAARALLPIA